MATWERTGAVKVVGNPNQVQPGGSVSAQYSSPSTTTTDNPSGVTQTQKTSATNMDPGSLAALQGLISQLLGGGTQEMVNQKAQRQSEISNVQGQRAAYTKEQAFADAQGAMTAQVAQVLEQLLPNINRAAKGAGTSQNSMRALMLQEAANNAAQSSAQLGLNAATAYGQVANPMNSVLEALTRVSDPATAALLDALQVAKGAVTTSEQTMTGTGGSGVGGGRVSGGSTGGGTQPSVFAGQQGSPGLDPSLDYRQNQPFVTVGPVYDPRSFSPDLWNAVMKESGAASAVNPGAAFYDQVSAGSWNDRVSF